MSKPFIVGLDTATMAKVAPPADRLALALSHERTGLTVTPADPVCPPPAGVEEGPEDGGGAGRAVITNGPAGGSGESKGGGPAGGLAQPRKAEHMP